VTFKVKLTAAIERCKMQQSKKSNKCQVDRREIAQLLAQGKDETARIRAEMLISQENLISALELYTLQANVLLQRLRLIAEAKFCPEDLLETCASMIYFGRNVSEIPEASNEIIEQLGYKFGSDWVQSHMDNRSGSVSPRMLQLLSSKPPALEVVLELLKAIAAAHSVSWTPKIVSPTAPPSLQDFQAIGQVASLRPKVSPLPPQTGHEPPGRERFMENENPARRTMMVRAQDMDLGGSPEEELAKYPGVLNISIHRARDLYNTSWTNAGVGQSGAQSVYARVFLYHHGTSSPPFGTNPPESLKQAVTNALSRRPGGPIADKRVYYTQVDALAGTVPVWNSPLYSFNINAPWTKVCFQVFARGVLSDKLIGSTIVNAHYLAFIMPREQMAAAAPVAGTEGTPVPPVSMRAWLTLGRGQAYATPAGAIEITADYQPFISEASAESTVAQQSQQAIPEVGASAAPPAASSPAASPSGHQQQQQPHALPPSSPRPAPPPRSSPRATPAVFPADVPPPAYEEPSGEDSLTLIPDSEFDTVPPYDSVAPEAASAKPAASIPSWTPQGGASQASIEVKSNTRDAPAPAPISTGTAPEISKQETAAAASSPLPSPRTESAVPSQISSQETKDATARPPKASTLSTELDEEGQNPESQASALDQSESDEAIHSMLMALDLPEPPKTSVGKGRGEDDADSSPSGGAGGSGGGGGQLVSEHVPIVMMVPSPKKKDSEPTVTIEDTEGSTDLDSILAARLAALRK